MANNQLLEMPGYLYNNQGISTHPLHRMGILQLPVQLGGDARPENWGGSPLHIVTAPNGTRHIVQGINPYKIIHLTR